MLTVFNVLSRELFSQKQTNASAVITVNVITLYTNDHSRDATKREQKEKHIQTLMQLCYIFRSSKNYTLARQGILSFLN